MHHFLFPCEENEMVPHVLNGLSFAVLAVLGLALIILPAGSRYVQLALLSGDPVVDSHAVADLVNGARVSEGLTPLIFNETLAASAADKARDIIEKQYFAHVAPDGTEPWDFFRKEGYVYTAAGENLALDFVSAEDAHSAFMNSPTHKANILGRLYTEVGIAVIKGIFNGHPSVVIVQHFGKPALASAAPVQEEATIPTPAKSPEPEEAVVEEGPVPVEEPGVSQGEPEIVAGSEAGLAVVTKPDMPVSEIFTTVVVGENIENHALTNHLVSTLVLRFAGLSVLVLLLVSFILGIFRNAAFSRGLVLRTIALFILFGYIGFFGIGTISLGEISQESFSTVVVQFAR